MVIIEEAELVTVHQAILSITVHNTVWKESLSGRKLGEFGGELPAICQTKIIQIDSYN